TLEFLLTSEDFSTLLTRTELLVRVAQHDNDLMATLEGEVAELEELETILTDSISAQETKKTDLSSKTQSLESSKSEIKATSDELKTKREELKAEMEKEKQELNALDKESDEYKALISKQEDELIALSAQMEEFIKNSGSSTTDKDEPETDDGGEESEGEEESKDNPYLDGTETVFSSGMIFPLKCSGVYISSPYGMRTHPTTGEYKLHTGTDFCAAGIDGKTVYAVKGGEVIYAAKHKAYGNFVIIDHGKGISSCYAHMQDGSMRVSVGDKVQQGQPIGKVGTTGYSTGPHLHFEIRVDGATTNPMSGYVQLPK
ncbi:MAG: peptidoglycan DD-metalloendopeptidase family protein, partial [Clostridia bacterium]|nr:peptidoglycan DD-metalloendopeptidase family protein [Clostridia bacterium]